MASSFCVRLARASGELTYHLGGEICRSDLLMLHSALVGGAAVSVGNQMCRRCAVADEVNT